MDDDTRIIVCRHCGRYIENDPEEGWIDRAAGYDDEDGDGVWRYTCDEHATFVASVVLGINAFDQFGVEYGKVLATSIEAYFGGNDDPSIDPATRALVQRLRQG